MAWLKEMPRSAIPAAVDGAGSRWPRRPGRQSDEDAVRRDGSSRGDRAGDRQRPEDLLLDEPTAGLDPEQRVSFRRLLREAGGDSCVVVSTHLVEDVAAACEDAILLDRGRLVFRGTIGELEVAADGAADEDGASIVERGYTALLHDFRARS